MVEDEFQRALAGAREGDEDAFGLLWRALHPALVRVLRSMAGADDAEDLASAVWVDVFRSIDTFVGTEDGFRAWLFTIARRRMIDLRRREGRRPEAPLDRPDDRPGSAIDPADSVASASATQAALDLIGSLPADQAEVVLLRVVAGLDVAAVAEIVGKRPGNVRVLSHRGLRTLAERLAQQADRPADPGSGVTR